MKDEKGEEDGEPTSIPNVMEGVEEGEIDQSLPPSSSATLMLEQQEYMENLMLWMKNLGILVHIRSYFSFLYYSYTL